MTTEAVLKNTQEAFRQTKVRFEIPVGLFASTHPSLVQLEAA
jgi:hypothetical protein